MGFGHCNARPVFHSASRPLAMTVSHVSWWPGSAWWGTATRAADAANVQKRRTRHTTYICIINQPSNHAAPLPFPVVYLSRLSPYACVTKRARAGLHSTSCPSIYSCLSARPRPAHLFHLPLSSHHSPLPLWATWATIDTH